VHALGGTIAFSVNHSAKQTQQYTLEIMTVAIRLGGCDATTMVQENTTCVVGDHKGAAGHVMLHYATGGKLLVSAGHWIELARLDVSSESLLRVAESNYGAEMKSQISCELSSARSGVEREQVVQRYAAQFVQQSAPCQYSSSKPGGW